MTERAINRQCQHLERSVEAGLTSTSKLDVVVEARFLHLVLQLDEFLREIVGEESVSSSGSLVFVPDSFEFGGSVGGN